MLFFSADPTHQAWFELPDGRTFWLRERNTIGRQLGNDLVLEDHTLSRQHALVTVGPSGFIMTDMQSRNGTYVDGHLITRPVLLHDGDEVRLGELALRFRCKRRMVLPDSALGGMQTTQVLEQTKSRACWLLVIDVEGYTAAVSELGGETALRKLQEWMAGTRPHLEQHRGHINRYVGDAIFAYWPGEDSKPRDVLAALRALEEWRPRSPLPFRVVVHHGSALFSKSDHGEELGGSDVTFVFRMEKIAKGFGSHAMLSPTAVTTLGVEDRCESYGRSAVDGMSNFFVFYGLPRDLVGGKS
ncbi:MAG: adenylate/guanylate cyclase domain-containing protein [Opitutaceae bacterium]|nr:adenylate/guanylate cyclase domain-containing protein [Opitutaceae bacterium]